jgi:hypothetical protein
MLRARRDLLGESSNEDETRSIDAEIEIAARRMVELWAHDPSLVIVLKHALKLFPAPDIFDAVVESSIAYFHDERSAHGAAHLVVSYVISDILKFAAIDLLQQDPALPQANGSSLDEIQRSVVKLAKVLLSLDYAPWYLRQQASMALIVLGEKTFTKKRLRQLDQPELSNYQRLSETDVDKYAKSSGSGEDAITIVAKQLLSKQPAIEEGSRNYPRQNNKWLSLGRLVESAANPFDTEHATLRLLEELIRKRSQFDLGGTPRPPAAFQVKCSNWADLGNPLLNLGLEIRLAQTPSPELNEVYGLPLWADKFTRFHMSLGMLGRAAFIGSQDYTKAWSIPRDQA